MKLLTASFVDSFVFTVITTVELLVYLELFTSCTLLTIWSALSIKVGVQCGDCGVKKYLHTLNYF